MVSSERVNTAWCLCSAESRFCRSAIRSTFPISRGQTKGTRAPSVTTLSRKRELKDSSGISQEIATEQSRTTGPKTSVSLYLYSFSIHPNRRGLSSSPWREREDVLLQLLQILN